MATELQSFVAKPCPYCGLPMNPAAGRPPTRDHVIPRSKAKSIGLLPHNKIIACAPCNSDKGSRTLSKWLDILVEAKDPRADHVRVAIDARALSAPAVAWYEAKIANLQSEIRELKLSRDNGRDWKTRALNAEAKLRALRTSDTELNPASVAPRHVAENSAGRLVCLPDAYSDALSSRSSIATSRPTILKRNRATE